MSVPDKQFDKAAVFDAIGTKRFGILYDLSKKITFLAIESSDAKERAANIMSAIPGLVISEDNGSAFEYDLVKAASAYRRQERDGGQIFSDIFDSGINSGYLAVLFTPMKMNEIEAGKKYMEKVLSKREESRTISILSYKKSNVSTHNENFHGSEEHMLLSELLESLNASILKNGIAYKIHLLFDTKEIEDYVRPRALVFSISELKKAKSFPFGVNTAKTFMNFYGKHGISYTINTTHEGCKGNLALGTMMKDAVYDTKEEVKIEPSSLNLGTLITGLPGSGKSNEAMAVIDSLNREATKVCVIAPTQEWDDFARNHDLCIIELYDNKTPINFFRCPPSAKKEKFYEDMAMILSSASNAGPYRNPMEKCMLNAFRKVYAGTNEPSPVAVYEAIVDSIRKFHAKKSNVGWKYTKHGENIMSALENLRAILCRPEYVAKVGIRLEELVEAGAVFNLSNVSVNTKPYMYALLLNQLYAIAGSFDMLGDNELRMLICVEEAQVIFKEKDSAAVQDIKYRIQDFRKQGVGLMLLSHNVIDIEPSIRRLCQTKIYLKQAPDVSAAAAKELVFTYAKEEEIAQKLKHLNSRIAALNYIIKAGPDKLSPDTIFIKTKEYSNSPAEIQSNKLQPYLQTNKIVPARLIDSKVSLEAEVSGSEKQKEVILEMKKLRFTLLGDDVETDISAETMVRGLLEGVEYRVSLLNTKGREIYATKVTAEKKIKVII
jgi:hypothetical protein